MKPQKFITVYGKKYPLYKLTVKSNVSAAKEITVTMSNTELYDFILENLDNPEIEIFHNNDGVINEYLPQEILDLPKEKVIEFVEKHYSF